MPSQVSGKKTSLAQRASWLLLAKTIAYASSLALPLLVVRRLSVLDYGLYKQAFLVVNSAVQLLPLGFTMSAYYFLPREPERRGAVVLNILLYCLAVGGAAGLVLALRPDLLVLILGEKGLAVYAPLIGLTIALWIPASFLEIVSVAHQDTHVSTVLIVGASVSRTVFLLGMAAAFGTIPALIWGAVIHGALQTGVLVVYLARRFPGFWREFDFAMLRTQLSYALPLGLAGLLWVMQTDLHNYFVSHQLGTVVFATYAIGCFELPLITMLSEAANSVLIPTVSLLEKEGRPDEVIRVVAAAQRKLAAVYFPLAAVLAVVAQEFIVFLFTARYADAAPIFRINMILLPFNAFTIDALMRSYAEFRYTLIRVRIGLFAVLCAALWLGIARYGGVGAISVVVALSVAERAILGVLIGRVAGVSRRHAYLLKDTGKIAVAAGLAAGATLLARSWMMGWRPFFVLAACGTIYLVFYAAAAIFMRVPNAAEWNQARQLLGARPGVSAG